jgi:hypothetical protein
MAETLLREEYSRAEHSAFISCSLEIGPDGSWVELVSEFLCRSPEGEDRFFIKHKSTISNPIELAVIVGALTTKYAICVAGSFTANATKEIYLAYGETKEDIQAQGKQPSLVERARTFGGKIKGRTKNFKAAALGAFAGCSAATFILP